MINFEEELRRFQPMLELDQVESAIHNQDIDDMANIAVNLIAEARAEAYGPGYAPVTPAVNPAGMQAGFGVSNAVL